MTSPWPLDWVYEQKTDSYNIDKFRTNEELINKIQSGKGDERFIYTGFKSIYIQIFLAGTVPEEPN